MGSDLIVEHPAKKDSPGFCPKNPPEGSSYVSEVPDNLASYINEVLEEERARIAREMHDELGQQLTALKMDMDTIQRKCNPEDQFVTDKLKEAILFIDQIIDTVRRISLELRPSILDDLGLLAALEWQCENFQKKTGIVCHLQQHVNRTDFDKGFTNAVFRILQEALTNINRHAHATQVDVAITEKDSVLIIEITDDGKGYSEKDQEKKSLGILGMKERARLIGGELKIRGEKNKGTLIKAILPMKSLTLQVL